MPKKSFDQFQNIQRSWSQKSFNESMPLEPAPKKDDSFEKESLLNDQPSFLNIKPETYPHPVGQRMQETFKEEPYHTERPQSKKAPGKVSLLAANLSDIESQRSKPKLIKNVIHQYSLKIDDVMFYTERGR